MNTRFERSGALTEINSYPQWAQDMIAGCEDARQRVLDHDLWSFMREARLDPVSTRNFMVGIWPFIEGFPGYMAQNLLKTRYGRSPGDDMARRWLVRNIRVEQNHAEYWLNWAEGLGISRKDVLQGQTPHGTDVLARWCGDISANGTLAAALAATNYAVEGITGEWARLIHESEAYTASIPPHLRKGSLRWLQLHAAYDDTHPWEALEIVCTLMGTAPSADEVAHVGECIRRSYVSICFLGDRCMAAHRSHALRQVAAA